MNYSLIKFSKIADIRGNLTFIQYPDQIPFRVKRVFWVYDLPTGETRGGHAYKTQQEIIIALSGSFDVWVIDRESNRICIHLNRPDTGLYLPPKTWRHVENFSNNALALHLSDSFFDADDYIWDNDLLQQ